jgi:hypothetical protein
VQIAPETYRADDETNKEYSAHLVRPKLNIHYLDYHEWDGLGMGQEGNAYEVG